MVRALLAGTKTQTRRALNARALTLLDAAAQVGECMHLGAVTPIPPNDMDCYVQFCAYGQPGERLWVRESFMPAPLEAAPGPSQTPWSIAYAAGGQTEKLAPSNYNPMLYNYERWTPSIHMPRWASRITLEITSVRVDRLQDISTADCWAEGIPASPDVDPAHEYRDLWEQINGPMSWAANPWVWVVEFKPTTATR